MNKTVLFDLICKAKNFEEADNILGDSQNDNSTVELHGDVMALSTGCYSESASLEVDNMENLELKISSMLSNKNIIIDNIEIQ